MEGAKLNAVYFGRFAAGAAGSVKVPFTRPLQAAMQLKRAQLGFSKYIMTS
jgi:hypothetical protein